MFWKSVEILTETQFKIFLKDLISSEQEVHTIKHFEREDFLDKAEFNDLYFLYKTIRDELVFSILEFGSGYSTLIQALALYQNKILYSENFNQKCRHPNPFQMLTIDASKFFLDISLRRIPLEASQLVRGVSSEVEIIEFGGPGGQLANRWLNFPEFTPDLIYVDGPDPEQFNGGITGFQPGTFGLPMSCDLISREFFFWSGTKIIFDGRGANAEFLRKNFRRNWTYTEDKQFDRHIFTLLEPPWGYFSREYVQFKQEIFDHHIPWKNSRESYLYQKTVAEKELK